MKKTLIAIGAILLIAGMSGKAAATPVILNDTTQFTSTGTIAPEDYVAHGRGAVNLLSTTALEALSFDFDYVTWKHQYTFNPAADHLISATLTLSFRDDAGEGDGGWKDEYAFGYTENGQWGWGEIDTGDQTYSIGVTSLLDGTFQVAVASLYGDFYLDKSVLSITYEPVPEPATMLLMGSGLAGLAAARRKFKTA